MVSSKLLSWKIRIIWRNGGKEQVRRESASKALLVSREFFCNHNVSSLAKIGLFVIELSCFVVWKTVPAVSSRSKQLIQLNTIIQICNQTRDFGMTIRPVVRFTIVQ